MECDGEVRSPCEVDDSDEDAAGGDGKTEFGRVMARLDIASIQALTPQAKGRVERANQTLQDRLVKELRLMGISSIDAANAVLPQFMAAWNEKFAVEARDDVDAHRPWDDTPDALDDRLARRDERTLSKALTFRADGTVYCVKTKGAGIALRGAKVELRHRLCGTMTVHYKDRILSVTAFRTYPMPEPAEDEKTIDLRLDRIVAAQRTATPTALDVGRG